MLKYYEPDSIMDYLLVPIWLMRYAFAFIINCFDLNNRFQSRTTDWTPIICERCLWAGPRRWAVHTYAQIGEDDVCPIDECPRCGAEI